MTFLIRTIDITASGREIRRERLSEAPTITVGRATENDIHLPDLAVVWPGDYTLFLSRGYIIPQGAARSEAAAALLGMPCGDRGRAAELRGGRSDRRRFLNHLDRNPRGDHHRH